MLGTKTRLIAAVALAPVALLLSGCISVTATLVVHGDATASGTMRMEMSKQFASMAGITSGDMLQQQIQQSGESSIDVGDCKGGETDASLTLECTFQNQAFTDQASGWIISREGDNVVVKVVNEGQTDSTMDTSSLGIPTGTLTVNLEMPGPIQSVTGEHAKQTGDNTVTVQSPMTDAVDVTVTSLADGGRPAWLVPLLIAVGVLVVAIGAGAIILAVRKSRGPTPGDLGGTDPGAPAAVAAWTPPPPIESGPGTPPVDDDHDESDPSI